MLLFTVIVLVVALIYFLFLIYWAIIASTKTVVDEFVLACR